MPKSRIRNFLNTAKQGYDATYWIFVLIGAAAILQNQFGIAGSVSVIVIFFFFYWMGRIHFKLQERDSREAAKTKK